MSSDAARHAQLEAKLDSLASLRQEVQRLYESTRAELYAVREEVTRERRARVALGAENARLQEWNRELSAQLSSLLEQRLRLELASVAVERAKLEAALQQARRGAEEAEERCGALARSGEARCCAASPPLLFPDTS
ncbi:hypothetical protein EMIHUDRAFT_241973 [Emiliania huxleyi CCMP1516]|uniref:Uncharacterized protein n=2 Tax=Emiliania huxleyi TaxID=2903 RepID=A0A0D3JAY8_EMIH1|nr:hypothetical protein EMIHUDRAFT_241973 [Emiliania huxleyi CCMP1516]EOD20673.1 hypothetical protein EMIHUDRAFT_241973 [Emiliania huxleyi CCMP1516]|eukprot:XP_005773102.1 hypothetical protein EMIHUDRAFT_241973 [Emiliania huxleyi CCMP1516]